MQNSKLIINADDFGCNSIINAAIVSCFCKGIINSTTIMVNMDGFEEAVKLAYHNGFANNIGLHVNLTEGHPLTDLAGTGLTNQNGQFIMQAASNPRNLLSPFTKSKIKSEIREQYNKLIATGIIPTHIDSHQHVHTLPVLAPIFIAFAKEKNQKLRIAAIRRRKNFFGTAYNTLLNRYIKGMGVHFTDRFNNVNYFMKYLQKKTNFIPAFEVMVHPSYNKDMLIDFLENTNLEENLRCMLELYKEKYTSK
ncbi:ChbG/HpnK family deacetylase [Ilyomonas limi]|uniref:ChbG/HpnK family deacetylase n=1 Tax=Ilyomonas limi TaxID=2575867 RepID=A0A4U3L5B1_9BACT|nr:ChbG/HpnK family deacetylase [Ilyomonas limi]TKK70335.1 ChbG/HpnK family deacetylase [Ilyomonas limi]